MHKLLASRPHRTYNYTVLTHSLTRSLAHAKQLVDDNVQAEKVLHSLHGDWCGGRPEGCTPVESERLPHLAEDRLPTDLVDHAVLLAQVVVERGGLARSGNFLLQTLDLGGLGQHALLDLLVDAGHAEELSGADLLQVMAMLDFCFIGEYYSCGAY